MSITDSNLNSGLWPHTPYAEDQPLAHLILTTHVLHRGFQVGALGGLLTGSVRLAINLRRSNPGPAIPSATKGAARVPPPSPRAGLLIARSTGIGGMIGIGLLSAILPYKMRGAELIQWQDRSWRLLENKGQVEVDRWSVAGGLMGIGAVVLAWRRGRALSSGKWNGWTLLGGVGEGSLAGVLGYIGWRYGLMRGER